MKNRTVWGGRYAVFDEIASGGMASVFLAGRMGAGEAPRVVAIKKLFEQFAKRPEFVTMFLDEAHLAASIRHPNVIGTYDFLRTPDSLAIVMEFVLGVSLDDLLILARDRRELPPVGVVATILHGALGGLHAAHEAATDQGKPYGLVHRDVSPQNILVGHDGRPCVIDFGIAKATGRLHVTDVGVIKGKYAYMSPEQLRGGTVDRRTDIYASGVVLWEALVGRLLFDVDTDASMLGRRAAGDVVVPVPSSINPAVPAQLDEVVEHALHVNPDERYETAREMATALTAAVDMAPPEQVASWVVALAGRRLRELEAQRNEVETAFAAGELPEEDVARPVPAAPRLAPAVLEVDIPDLAPSVPEARPVARTALEVAVADLAPPNAPPAAAAVLEIDIPDLVPPKAAPKLAPKPKPKGTPGATRQAPRAAPPAPAFDDSLGDFGAADVRLDLAMPAAERPRTSPGRSPARSLDARAVALAGREDPADRPRRGGRWLARLATLLVLAGVGAVSVRWLPGFVKSALVAAAARRGIVLSAESVELQGMGLALSGVTLRLPDVPEVTMKAPEVDLAFDWQGSLQKVGVPSYELALKGDATDLAAHFSSWRGGPHLPFAFEASSGHLLWSGASSPAFGVEGIDVGLAFGTRGEGSVHLETKSLSVSVARATLGPWRAVLDTRTDETKLVMALDRSKPDGPPLVTFVERPTLGRIVSVTIPRVKASQIGIPGELIQSGADPEIELSLEGQVLPTGSPLTAHAALGLFGVPLPAWSGVAAPLDLSFEGAIAGDPTALMHIDPGTLTVSRMKSKMSGTVTIGKGGVSVEIDRHAAKGAKAQPGWLFDTRDWTDARDAAPAAKVPPPASASAAPSGKRR